MNKAAIFFCFFLIFHDIVKAQNTDTKINNVLNLSLSYSKVYHYAKVYKFSDDDWKPYSPEKPIAKFYPNFRSELKLKYKFKNAFFTSIYTGNYTKKYVRIHSDYYDSYFSQQPFVRSSFTFDHSFPSYSVGIGVGYSSEKKAKGNVFFDLEMGIAYSKTHILYPEFYEPDFHYGKKTKWLSNFFADSNFNLKIRFPNNLIFGTGIRFFKELTSPYYKDSNVYIRLPQEDSPLKPIVSLGFNLMLAYNF